MVDLKAFLPGHKQTEKEGGSSYTHPLGHTTDQHNPQHEAGSVEGDTGLYPRVADTLAERDTYPTGGHNPEKGLQDRQPAAPGSLSGGGQQQIGEEQISRSDIAGGGAATAAGVGQVDGSHTTHNNQAEPRRGAGGLETRDPYEAAKQAGALPDKQDIRAVDAEVAVDRRPQPSGPDRQSAETGFGVSAGQDTKSSAGETPAHGLNAGVEDPIAVTGRAPISEPVRPDADLDPYAGQAATTAATRAEEIEEVFGPSRLKEPVGGLIHGHHTTVTGETLDPHISGTGR